MTKATKGREAAEEVEEMISRDATGIPKTKNKFKRVVVDQFGGPEVLKVVEEEAPRPSEGEVRVRVLG